MILGTDKTTRIRTYGFRINLKDILIIIGCGLVTWLIWPWLGQMSLMLPIVLGHFFLFCNVFRIHRRLELVWAGIFLANVIAWSLMGSIIWWKILALQTSVSILLIGLEMKQPHYHGLGARRINRRHLDSYLCGNQEN